MLPGGVSQAFAKASLAAAAARAAAAASPAAAAAGVRAAGAANTQLAALKKVEKIIFV